MNHNYAPGTALLQAYLTSAAIRKQLNLPPLLSLFPSLHPSTVLHQLPQLAPSLHPSPLIPSDRFLISSNIISSVLLYFFFLWFSLCLFPAPLVLTQLNIAFNISPSVPRSSVSLSPTPLLAGVRERVLMLVNYSCVEGTNRALDWWLTAWLSSSITVNKAVRQRERREAAPN